MHFVRGQQRRPTRQLENEDGEGSGKKTEKEKEREREKESAKTGWRERKREKEIRARGTTRGAVPRDAAVGEGGRKGRREEGVARQGLGQAVLDSAQLPRTEV